MILIELIDVFAESTEAVILFFKIKVCRAFNVEFRESSLVEFKRVVKEETAGARLLGSLLLNAVIVDIKLDFELAREETVENKVESSAVGIEERADE